MNSHGWAALLLVTLIGWILIGAVLVRFWPV